MPCTFQSSIGSRSSNRGTAAAARAHRREGCASACGIVVEALDRADTHALLPGSPRLTPTTSRGKRRPNLSPITGWCSWEAYGRGIDAGRLRKAVDFLEANLAAYGLEYIQIDDGYQSEPIPPTAEGDLRDSWHAPNERFPAGHADIQHIIAAAGFKAGIWTSAAVTNRDFAGRNGNCLIGAGGVPVEEDWIHFVPSCSEEFLRGQIVPLYRGLEEKGYRYFKADSLRHLIYEGLMGAAEAGILTNDDAENRFRRYIESVREGVGPEAFLVACWGVLSQAVGCATRAGSPEMRTRPGAPSVCRSTRPLDGSTRRGSCSRRTLTTSVQDPIRHGRGVCSPWSP